jgi:hypothetical protein
VTGDTAWPDERNYIDIKSIVLTKPVSTAESDANYTNSDKRAGEFKCATPARNSLAYLLSQNQKRAAADIRADSKKTGQIGNSLAYLLSHKQ